MPSLIPNFEYDIFISYRHNDNRSGWVTALVKALKEELAATIKEPVSVYFDTNLNDGLLETHNVDKSLEGKLKSLIFIPIISQTYCDTKSFAWQHEFCAFNKLAKEDQFGRDIKLSTGNVASRILPIKIHELDVEDKSIIENEIGGAVRAIEFIYKESGVNRPLKPTDDRTDNQNKTDYRNQINKVANAIKEIMGGLKNPSSPMGISALKNNIPKYESFDSIAVLPFANMSSDPDQEYFSDGISEEIINVLVQLPNLKVAGRTSSFTFKGKSEDLREIGEKLGVKTVLEGSIRRSGNRLRITAQLIDVQNGFHIWSEKYDREMKDIFEIQDEIAQAIVEELKLHLLDEGSIQLSKSKRQNLDAYNCYLKGRFFWNNNRSKEGIERTIKYFEQAIELEPGYALAYSGLTESYAVMADWGYIQVEKAIPKIREYSSRAHELDPALVSNHFAILYTSCLEWDWQNARIEGQKALQFDPKSARVHHMYGFSKMFSGNFKEALEHNSRARELDPLALIFNFARGLILYMDRQFDEAILEWRKAIELDSGFAPAYFWATHCYILKEMDVEAVEGYKKLLAKDPVTEKYVASIDDIFRQSGITGFLHWLINIGIELHVGTYNQAYHKAVCYSLLKDKEKSFEWMALACEQRSFRISLIKYDPGFDNLRDDSRFDLYSKKVGLD